MTNSERLTLRITPDQKRFLKSEADRQNLSVSNLVCKAVDAYKPVIRVTLDLPQTLAGQVLDLLSDGHYSESLRKMAEMLDDLRSQEVSEND